MSRRLLAILILLLAVLAGGILLRGRKVSLSEADRASRGVLPPPANDPNHSETLTALGEDRPDRRGEPTTEDSMWIAGRVVFPENTPSDENAEVAVGDDPFDVTKWRAFPVASDGSFRAELQKSWEFGFVDVRGRYLYLKQPLRISTTESPAEELRLAPKLGGALRGRLVLPESARGRAASLVGLQIKADSTTAPSRWMNGDHSWRTAVVDPSLEFEFGGLAPGRRVDLSAEPKGFAKVEAAGPPVASGKVASIDVPLRLGVRVRGRVVDEARSPAADVEVWTNVKHERFTIGAPSGRSTGTDGSFDIAGIDSGKLTLSVKKAGFAGGSLLVGELADGDSIEGLEVVLVRGLSISGRVRWPDGRPAPHSRVAAEITDEASEAADPFDFESRSAVADAEGAFEIGGLDVAVVTLTAQSEFRGGVWTPPAGPKSGFVRVENIRPGTTGLELTLEPGGEVRGRVVDDLGSIVPRFRMSAVPLVAGVNPGQRDENAVHGSFQEKDGTFALAGLREGDWDVTADAEGYATSAAHRVVVPRDTDSFELVVPRAATISGTVVDPWGAQVARALVRKSETGSLGKIAFTSFGRTNDDESRTDADGHFRIEDLVPVETTLVATAEGFADSAPMPVELVPGRSVENVSLVLRRGGRITGEVLDDASKPVSGWTVLVDLDWMRRISVISDQTGRFGFDGLSPGKYVIRARPPSTTQGPTAADLLPGGMTDDTEVEKRASATVVEGQTTHIVIGGRPRESIRIRGTIRSAGRPRAGCQVTAFAREPSSAHPRPCTSDEKGRYEIVVHGAGRYDVSVRAEDAGISLYEELEVPEQSTFEHDIELPTGRIAGWVVGLDGTPAKDIEVDLIRDARSAEPGIYSTRTDASGAFVFDGLSPGTYDLHAGDSPGFAGFDPSSAKVGICTRSGIQVPERGHVEGLELRLQAVARVEGMVVGPNGAPVASAKVFAFDERGDLMYGAMTVSDSTGRFGLDGLEPSRTSFGAFTKTLAPVGFEPVALRAGELTRIEIAVRPGTKLLLVFEDARGERVGANARVVDERGADWSWTSFLSNGVNVEESDPMGGCLIGPLPSGRYRVTATNSDKKTTNADVSVSGDEQTVTLKFGE